MSADHHSRCRAVPAASRFAERTARAAGLSADDVRATAGFYAQIMPFAERPVPAVRRGCPRQNSHQARHRRGRSAALCTAAHRLGFDTLSRHAERT
ncbi:hypothetical protein ABZ721_10510 [Streptomyces sp. NPDC006733]|uniref:hypothetical protein n=1 Tax=Streptomyces sp. NPDC006733 TaxID=3155460 RepID=UPI0033E6DD0C